MLRTKLALVANLVVLAAVAWGFSREYLHNNELEAQVTTLEQKGRALERDSLQLVEQQRRHDDASGIERDARLKLGLQKPGEQVVVVRSTLAAGQEHAAATAADDDAPADPIDNARGWWQRFFGTRQ